MEVVAVLTGDIISSGKISHRDQLIRQLKEVFGLIDHQFSGVSGSFEIFRGDSFQGVVFQPDKALLAAVLIRARLRWWKENGTIQPDARVAIGIGERSYTADRIIESDGEAFRYSGLLVDALKTSGSHLGIETPWKSVNDEARVLIALLDALIDKWSAADAEVVYLQLSEKLTQVQLARRAGISQPAVSKRLIHANLAVIKKAMIRFEQLIKSQV